MTGLLEHPSWLPGLAAVCAAIAFAGWAGQRRAHRRRRLLLGPGDLPNGFGRGRDAVLLLALGLVVVAGLGPRLGRLEVQPATGGADVVLLFDLSRSMDAGDTPPSRLQRAVASGRALLEKLAPGDRVALAGFAGRGVLFTPLTPDRVAIAGMMLQLDSRMIRPQGSELAAGIEAAVRAFEPGGERPRVVVLWSDGELSDPGGALGGSEARREDVRVVAVGLGGEAGAMVPDRGAPLRDHRGEEVVSRRSLATLRRLSDATGGLTLAADAWGAVAAEQLAAAIDQGTSGPDALAGARSSARDTLDHRPASHVITTALVWPFAAAAAALLLAEAFAAGLGLRGPRVGRREARRRRRTPAAALAALGASAVLGLGARWPATDTFAPEDPATYVLRGLLDVEVGDVDRARQRFAAAAVLSSDPQIVAIAEYDLGVLALGQDQLERARDHFLAALVYSPGDHRTRFNAEWTLRAIAARQPGDPTPEPPPSGPGTPRPGGESTDESTPERADGQPGGDAAAIRDGARGANASHRPATHDAGATPPLDPSARARWLEQIRDDPALALSLAARGERRGAPPPRRRMQW